MPEVSAKARGRVRGYLLRWSILMALWLALVDNAKLAELVTGAIAAALAATAAELAEEGTVVRPRLRPRFLGNAWRPFARLPVDTAVVAWELVRRIRKRPRGRLRAVRFQHDVKRDSAARHVLAESLGSLAPNRYVVGIDTDDEYMLVHELVPVEAPLDPLELG